jgi:DNA polymerase III subunit delta
MVGGWRTQTIWKIVELIASGRAAEAIEQQDRLFTGGQNALGIFAPLSWSMRRFGVAAHLVEQAERNGTRVALPLALEKAGFRKNEIKQAETQLRRIGRQRGKKLLEWLLELELKLKGSHSNEHLAKFALEEFILRLA